MEASRETFPKSKFFIEDDYEEEEEKETCLSNDINCSIPKTAFDMNHIESKTTAIGVEKSLIKVTRKKKIEETRSKYDEEQERSLIGTIHYEEEIDERACNNNNSLEGTDADHAYGTSDEELSIAHNFIYETKSVHYIPPNHMDMEYGYILRYRGRDMVTFNFHRQRDNAYLFSASMGSNCGGNIYFHLLKDLKLNASPSTIPRHGNNAAYLGCVEANFLGNEFIIQDFRSIMNENMKKNVDYRYELGLVRYETNVLGRVPNSRQAILPRWDPEYSLRGKLVSLSKRFKQSQKTCSASSVQAASSSKVNSKYQAVEVNDEIEELLVFETKKPSWNPRLNAWTLDFNGRVSIASKKNFILVPESKNEVMDEEFGCETTCLRFGKAEKDKFNLDYRYPISPIQAVGIALTGFTKKLVVS